MTAKRDVSREYMGRDALGESSFDAVAPDPTPIEIAVFNESLDQLLDLLSPLQQQIVSLRLKGFSNVEISGRIGRTERTVYRTLAQVRKIFRGAV